jgi:hypothetical protein
VFLKQGQRAGAGTLEQTPTTAASPSAEISGDATAGFLVYLNVYSGTYVGDLIIAEAASRSRPTSPSAI